MIGKGYFISLLSLSAHTSFWDGHRIWVMEAYMKTVLQTFKKSVKLIYYKITYICLEAWDRFGRQKCLLIWQQSYFYCGCMLVLGGGWQEKQMQMPNRTFYLIINYYFIYYVLYIIIIKWELFVIPFYLFIYNSFDEFWWTFMTSFSFLGVIPLYVLFHIISVLWLSCA